MKTVKKQQLKIVIFTAVKNRCLLHGRVFVMKQNHEEIDLNRGKIPQCMSIYGEIHFNTGKNHSFYVNFLLI